MLSILKNLNRPLNVYFQVSLTPNEEFDLIAQNLKVVRYKGNTLHSQWRIQGEGTGS